MIDPKRVLQAALREDFATFVHKTFQTVSPGDQYLHNWHIEAISHALMQAHGGASKRVLITQPPRSLKSICSSVAFVAWALGRDPTLRFICVSYSQELALELARQFRLVVEADWYLELFPRMRLKKAAAHEFVTTRGGGRVATSIGGTLTGRGANIIVIDDPLKAEDAQSEVARRNVINWYRGTLATRLNNQNEGRIIVAMQRLHEEDLAGHILESGEPWRHLNLPAIAEEDERIEIGANRFHVRRKGEVLHAAREPHEVLERLRAKLGSLTFSAQYQQSPVPAEGNLIKRDWFKQYENAAADGQIVQSWDLASSTSATADYSACVTAKIKDKKIYVLDVWRGRLDYPALKKHVIAHARAHVANTVLIEKAGPGDAMLAELRASTPKGMPTPIPIKVASDKAVRLESASAVVERGDVLLPAEAPWLGEFMRELLGFPNGRHDDQADAFSQLINWYVKRTQRPRPIPVAPQLIPMERLY